MIDLKSSFRRVHLGGAARQFAVVTLTCLGCADEQWRAPPPLSQQQFLDEFEQWREWRRARMTQLGGVGPVTWIGLWELPVGATSLGSDSSLPIVLPAAHAPKLLGALHRSGQLIRFEPAAGAPIRLAGGGLVTQSVTMNTDRDDSTTTLAAGSLRLRVHSEPGTERLWLRVWDEEHPLRTTFKLPDAYAPDTAWRLAARFDSFAQPRVYSVPDVRGGTQGLRSPGELVFRVRGKEQRLVAFAEPKDTNFFVVIWDSTARSTTYQAGRHMRVAFPDSTGWTVLDFNRAYNPTCAFTPYSVCAFAPQENHMQFAITAGEKRLVNGSRTR